ncbi:MAG: RDD family protein [Halobacillus sp.]|uniref:RDD family protein n=1 Tax=Halobacillus sp. TaxID=56800 RepID=UPI003BAF175B
MNSGLERAGFKVRGIAFMLDFLIVSIPFAFLFSIVNDDFSLEFTQGFSWDIGYGFYLTVLPVIWSGYIIGKRIFRIHVVKVNGKRLTLLDMFIREIIGKLGLAYLTFGLSSVISAAMVAFLKDRRSIHDHLSGTCVDHSY